MKIEFADKTKELCVIVTVTNWNEPPRIRHEVAYQLSRNFNVLYIQLYEKRGVKRPVEQINKSLIVHKSGFGFPGIGRLFKLIPTLKTIYNYLVSKEIENLIKLIKVAKPGILVNFQYDLPQINSIKGLRKSVYFCNDDFVNQDLSSTQYEINRKEIIQSKVIKSSDIVVTVSYPLKESLQKFGKRVEILLSGHSFDLDLSRNFKVMNKKINVCYMGFLNNGIAVNWLEHILQDKRVTLTIIGPIEVPDVKKIFSTYSNFVHIQSLTGKELQNEMLKNDVMVMPYSSPVENKVTSVPGKLFQYLAVGKPIVSSELQNLILLPDGFVYKSASKEEFLSNIVTAKEVDSNHLKEKRILYSEMHTWNARGDQLFKILES